MIINANNTSNLVRKIRQLEQENRRLKKQVGELEDAALAAGGEDMATLRKKIQGLRMENGRLRKRIETPGD